MRFTPQSCFSCLSFTCKCLPLAIVVLRVDETRSCHRGSQSRDFEVATVCHMRQIRSCNHRSQSRNFAVGAVDRGTRGPPALIPKHVHHVKFCNSSQQAVATFFAVAVATYSPAVASATQLMQCAWHWLQEVDFVVAVRAAPDRGTCRAVAGARAQAVEHVTYSLVQQFASSQTVIAN